MKIEYKLNKEDFLIHLWYQLDNDEELEKAKFKYLVRLPLIFISIGFVLYITLNDSVSLTILLISSMLWFLVAPKLYKKERRKEFEKTTNEHIRKRDSENATIIINKDYLISKEDFYESKHYKTEITNLVEIQNHFIINFKDTENKMILPKKYVARPKELIDIFLKMDIEYIDNSDWKK